MRMKNQVREVWCGSDSAALTVILILHFPNRDSNILLTFNYLVASFMLLE